MKCVKIKLTSNNTFYEYWIDLSSGLVAKMHQVNETGYEMTIDYDLKLDCVTDKEVTVPDLSNYKVEQL